MAGDPPRAWHAKLTAMAMLFSHAEATERMVALPATADGGQKINPEAARRACRLWLEALGVTRSRKSEQTCIYKPRCCRRYLGQYR